MKILLTVIGVVIVIFLIIYVKKWISRIICNFNFKNEKKVRLVSIIITSLIFLLMLNVSSVISVLLIFAIMSFLIADFLKLILKVLFKRNDDKFYKFFNNGIFSLVIVFIITVLAYFNATWVRQTNYEFYTNKELKNGKLKIVQISDLHYPASFTNSKLDNIVNNISKSKADLVVLTGDIFDEHTTKKQMKEGIKILSKLKSRYGTYFIFGNHDDNKYSKNKVYDYKELIRILSDNNITVLQDETILLGNDFYLIGRKDKTSKERKSVKELLNEVDKDKYVILLDHQPTDFKTAKDLGTDLELSGHTHGGQIFPLGLTMSLYGISDIRAGVKTIGGYNAVVSSGTGTWSYPLRTEGKSEYVIINVYQN